MGDLIVDRYYDLRSRKVPVSLSKRKAAKTTMSIGKGMIFAGAAFSLFTTALMSDYSSCVFNLPQAVNRTYRHLYELNYPKENLFVLDDYIPFDKKVDQVELNLVPYLKDEKVTAKKPTLEDSEGVIIEKKRKAQDLIIEKQLYSFVIGCYESSGVLYSEQRDEEAKLVFTYNAFKSFAIAADLNINEEFLEIDLKKTVIPTLVKILDQLQIEVYSAIFLRCKGKVESRIAKDKITSPIYILSQYTKVFNSLNWQKHDQIEHELLIERFRKTLNVSSPEQVEKAGIQDVVEAFMSGAVVEATKEEIFKLKDANTKLENGITEGMKKFDYFDNLIEEKFAFATLQYPKLKDLYWKEEELDFQIKEKTRGKIEVTGRKRGKFEPTIEAYSRASYGGGELELNTSADEIKKKIEGECIPDTENMISVKTKLNRALSLDTKIERFYERFQEIIKDLPGVKPVKIFDLFEKKGDKITLNVKNPDDMKKVETAVMERIELLTQLQQKQRKTELKFEKEIDESLKIIFTSRQSATPDQIKEIDILGREYKTAIEQSGEYKSLLQQLYYKLKVLTPIVAAIQRLTASAASSSVASGVRGEDAVKKAEQEKKEKERIEAEEKERIEDEEKKKIETEKKAQQLKELNEAKEKLKNEVMELFFNKLAKRVTTAIVSIMSKYLAEQEVKREEQRLFEVEQEKIKKYKEHIEAYITKLEENTHPYVPAYSLESFHIPQEFRIDPMPLYQEGDPASVVTWENIAYYLAQRNSCIMFWNTQIKTILDKIKDKIRLLDWKKMGEFDDKRKKITGFRNDELSKNLEEGMKVKFKQLYSEMVEFEKYLHETFGALP